MNDVKEVIYNCLLGTEEVIRYTDEEQIEIDKIKEEEANKPKPETQEEKNIRLENTIESLKQENSLLENAILEMAEIQSSEYKNRLILENAVIELANLIGGE